MPVLLLGGFREHIVLGKGNSALTIKPEVTPFAGKWRINATRIGFGRDPDDTHDFDQTFKIIATVTPRLQFNDSTIGATVGGLFQLINTVGTLEVWQNTAAGADFSTKFNSFILTPLGNVAFNNTSTSVPTFGGGEGVLFIRIAVTIPSSNPTSSALFYIDPADTVFKVRTTNGVITNLAPRIGGAGQVQTVQDTNTTAIDNVTPTILLTLPSVATSGRKAVIKCSIQLENTAGAARMPSLRLFRDGTEIDTTDRYDHRMVTGDDNITISWSWVDSNPTGAHVYTIRALGDNTGLNRITNSRAVVFA